LLLKQKINNATSTAETLNSIPFASALCRLIKKYCNCDAEKDADRPIIGAIKESLRGQLTSIASKLLNSEHLHFHQLSEEEQQLWQQFDKSEVYKFITGEKDTLPEFQFDWIEPCQLAVHLPPGVILAAHRDLQPPTDQAKPPAQLAAQPVPIPQQAPPPPPAPLAPHGGDQLDQQQPVAGPSGQQLQSQHDLRPCQDINYKELHTGIKQRCRKLRRQDPPQPQVQQIQQQPVPPQALPAYQQQNPTFNFSKPMAPVLIYT
jgi:hypothetical protein